MLPCPHPAPSHPFTSSLRVLPSVPAVSTSAETWFINTEFERNIAGQYGGAILLEGGCPAAYFLNYWFKVPPVVPPRRLPCSLHLPCSALGSMRCAV